ncbi:MAG: hypothetical protein A2X61_08330 [Ignavibacteria bacterium GWB2_35_12]|nr:MAG: hypothetical protein A2X63_09235 [Ignavibacteria bacterium GWA2_35_8]OGU39128.1 MAG: hypothetical protein A2X61_08330 [Ignavibacteria bacterium GWB2_35_12]OGU89965.1 MAG: hypothetical protein A2220_17170 [Ignavibacteria bacterium RIFOXYA2_FULL_35_10]OGV22250.1 MAG: hypothetical protein A2475_12970 [Ignavibacteria bacterium RIFOXYC2_FULL_35_21]
MYLKYNFTNPNTDYRMRWEIIFIRIGNILCFLEGYQIFFILSGYVKKVTIGIWFLFVFFLNVIFVVLIIIVLWF